MYVCIKELYSYLIDMYVTLHMHIVCDTTYRYLRYVCDTIYRYLRYVCDTTYRHIFIHTYKTHIFYTYVQYMWMWYIHIFYIFTHIYIYVIRYVNVTYTYVLYDQKMWQYHDSVHILRYHHIYLHIFQTMCGCDIYICFIYANIT